METKYPDTSGSEARGTQGGHRRASRFGKGAFLVVLALGAGVAGSVVSTAYAEGSRGVMGAPSDPAKMDEHVDRMVKHLAVEVDASPEQKAKLAVIVKSAAKDLIPLRAQLRDARKQGITLLAAATIDRNALEQLRRDQIALMDSSSKRLSQALADAAEVLTTEQRQKLAERMNNRGGRFGHHFGHG